MIRLFGAAWGEKYVDFFLRAGLPSILATNNAQKFAKHHTCRFDLFTSQQDVEKIENDVAFQQLRKLMPGTLRVIPANEFKTQKYSLLSVIQSSYLRQVPKGDVIIPLYADTIYSDGFLDLAVSKVTPDSDNLGSKAVDVYFCSAPRVLWAETVKALPETSTTGTLDLAPDLVASLLGRFGHADNDACEAGKLNGLDFPSVVRWTVAPNAFLFKSFHLHPAVFRMNRAGNDPLLRFSDSLDGGFVSKLVQEEDQIEVHPGSQAGSVVSLSPPTDRAIRAGNFEKTDILRISRWAERNAGPIHRCLFRQSVRWQTEPSEVGPDAWAKTEHEADQFSNAVFQRLSIPDSLLRSWDIGAFHARKAGVRAAKKSWSVDSEITTKISEMSVLELIGAGLDRLKVRLGLQENRIVADQLAGVRIVVAVRAIKLKLTLAAGHFKKNERQIRYMNRILRIQNYDKT